MLPITFLRSLHKEICASRTNSFGGEKMTECILDPGWNTASKVWWHTCIATVVRRWWMVWSLTTLVHCRYYNIKIQPQSNINDDFPVPHPHPIPLKSGPRTTSDNSSFMEPRKFVKIISLLSPIKLSGLLASQLCLPLWMRSFAAVWNFPQFW